MRSRHFGVISLFAGALLACGGSSSTYTGIQTTQVGTVTATINGSPESFPVLQYDEKGMTSQCYFIANATNPSDSILTIVGYTGTEQIYLAIGTPTQGGSWSSDDLHFVEYASDYDVTSTNMSSKNPGGSASITLTKFAVTLGTTAAGTFSGTLTSTDGSQTTAVTAGTFSCTTGQTYSP